METWTIIRIRERGVDDEGDHDTLYWVPDTNVWPGLRRALSLHQYGCPLVWVALGLSSAGEHAQWLVNQQWPQADVERAERLVRAATDLWKVRLVYAPDRASPPRLPIQEIASPDGMMSHGFRVPDGIVVSAVYDWNFDGEPVDWPPPATPG